MSDISRFLGRFLLLRTRRDQHRMLGTLTEEPSVSGIRSSYVASSSQAPFPPNRASRSNTVVPEPPRPSNAADDQKQQILWERCCQPLQYLASAGFVKAHGFNVVPSADPEWGEEDNVFGFFTAGISAHESTDRDESSEVTLVEFAALLDGWARPRDQRSPQTDRAVQSHSWGSSKC